jgi:hypothetical protein
MNKQQYIEEHKNMFWYTLADKKAEISDALLVETILNDGTLADYKSLLQVLGPKRVAEVFFSATGRQKQNYYPEIYHFFSLLLAKYAHLDIDIQSEGTAYLDFAVSTRVLSGRRHGYCFVPGASSVC